MPVGNEIFPNVFIDNIEVFDTGIEFMVLVFDYIDKPTWTKNNTVLNRLRLNVAIEGDVEKKLKYDVALFPTNKITGDNPYYQNSIVYYKKITITTKSSSKVSDLSIMCNLFLEGTNIIGPSLFEPVLISDSTTSSTVAYYKNGTQYYGPVHSHRGAIMEGISHTDASHATLNAIDVHNLKVKDYRSEKYNYSSLEKRHLNTNLPIFSDLFVSYDEETIHKGVFFINLLEIMRRNTKFGTYFDSVSASIRSRMINNIEIKSIIITRNQINTTYGNDGIYKPIRKETILLGFEKGKSLSQLNNEDLLKNNLRYIHHDYGNSIIGIEFVDEDMNDSSFGAYQYSIDIIFSDKTAEILRSYTQRIDSLINRARSYLYKLNNPNYYNHSLKKTKNTFYSSEQSSESFIFLANELAFLKSIVFDLTDATIREEKIKYYSLLEPNSCTIESVSFYLKEATKIYNEFVTLFGKNRIIGSKYEKPTSPKSNSYVQNTINIKHIFKQIVQPDNSKVHYSFNSEEITFNNFKKTMSNRPLMFGSKNRKQFLKFKSGKGNKEIKNKMNNQIKSSKVNSLSVGRVVTLPKRKKEKFTNVTDYLGKGSQFASFEAEEKCEIIKPDSEIFDEVSLNVVTESEDIIEEISNMFNKVEFLESFETNAKGNVLLKKPIWRDVLSQTDFDKASTVFIKQEPAEGRKKVIDFSFPNQYKLLNNLNSRNTNNTVESSDNVLTDINNIVRSVDMFRTSNGLSSNEGDSVTIVSRPVRRSSRKQTNRIRPMTTTTGEY